MGCVTGSADERDTARPHRTRRAIYYSPLVGGLMLHWFYEWLGEAFVAIPLFIISIVSEICEWIAWSKLRRGPPASPVRRRAELTSLGAGTASISLGILILLIPAIPWVVRGAEWVIDLWIYIGMGVSGLVLLTSLFSRHWIRVSGIIVGVIMSALWWEMWELWLFAQAYSG
jgi:hypothetical protein